jgi:iron complex transport system substrate-binding protein
MKNSAGYRIVSLVPSLTETLCHFGLQDSILGCTNFCVEPRTLLRSAKSVGGTKDADVEKIVELRPTHVVVNLEENTESMIAEIKRQSQVHSFKVIETFLESPEDNFPLIETLGNTFHFQKEAALWCEDARERLNLLKQKMESGKPFRFAYFIWMNPWMVVGDKTYISRTLSLIKGENVIITGSELAQRYPAVRPEDVASLSPDWLFFSSEPFPFKNRHIENFLQHVKTPQMCLKVDGQAMSWYGSRFTHTLSKLEKLHGQLFND